MAKNNTKKTTKTKPYYQTKGLLIDGILKKFDYLPGSPRFHALGPDFIDNYGELKKLVEQKREESTVIQKDKTLIKLLKAVLRNFYPVMPEEEKTAILKEWLEITEDEKKDENTVNKHIEKEDRLEKEWSAAGGDRKLYETKMDSDESGRVGIIDEEKQETPFNPPYYQVDGLQIDDELKKCDHLPNSFKLYALGMDFVNGYNHLIGMVETGIDENIIREKDQELIKLLKTILDNMDKPTIDNLGNIPEIITNVAKENKSLLENTKLMVKNCTNCVEFYAIGHNGAPIMENGKPKKYTTERLKGSSEIITDKNFLNAFANLRTTNKNTVFFLYLTDTQDIDKTQLKVRLYTNGQQDIKFGEKLFENWILGK